MPGRHSAVDGRCWSRTRRSEWSILLVLALGAAIGPLLVETTPMQPFDQRYRHQVLHTHGRKLQGDHAAEEVLCVAPTTRLCTVCDACCEDLDKAGCDACTARKCNAQDRCTEVGELDCNVCPACCEAFLVEQADCDACVRDVCVPAEVARFIDACDNHGTAAHPVTCCDDVGCWTARWLPWRSPCVYECLTNPWFLAVAALASPLGRMVGEYYGMIFLKEFYKRCCGGKKASQVTEPDTTWDWEIGQHVWVRRSEAEQWQRREVKDIRYRLGVKFDKESRSATDRQPKGVVVSGGESEAVNKEAVKARQCTLLAVRVVGLVQSVNVELYTVDVYGTRIASGGRKGSPMHRPIAWRTQMSYEYMQDFERKLLQKEKGLYDIRVRMDSADPSQKPPDLTKQLPPEAIFNRHPILHQAQTASTLFERMIKIDAWLNDVVWFASTTGGNRKGPALFNRLDQINEFFFNDVYVDYKGINIWPKNPPQLKEFEHEFKRMESNMYVCGLVDRLVSSSCGRRPVAPSCGRCVASCGRSVASCGRRLCGAEDEDDDDDDDDGKLDEVLRDANTVVSKPCFTMGNLCSPDSSWRIAAESNDLTTQEAGYRGVAQLFFLHIPQPLLFIFVFYDAYPNLDTTQQKLGTAVAVREAVCLLSVCLCLRVNPAFLLVDIRASVDDIRDSAWESGVSFLLMFVLAPEKFVLCALFGKWGYSGEELLLLRRSGLPSLSKLLVAMMVSAGLDLCALAALGYGLGAGGLSFLSNFTALAFGYGFAGVGALWMCSILESYAGEFVVIVAFVLAYLFGTPSIADGLVEFLIIVGAVSYLSHWYAQRQVKRADEKRQKRRKARKAQAATTGRYTSSNDTSSSGSDSASSSESSDEEEHRRKKDKPKRRKKRLKKTPPKRKQTRRGSYRKRDLEPYRSLSGSDSSSEDSDAS